MCRYWRWISFYENIPDFPLECIFCEIGVCICKFWYVIYRLLAYFDYGYIVFCYFKSIKNVISWQNFWNLISCNVAPYLHVLKFCFLKKKILLQLLVHQTAEKKYHDYKPRVWNVGTKSKMQFSLISNLLQFFTAM